MTIECKNMQFSDCELAILREAVDKAEIREGAKKIRDPKIQEIISVVECMLRSKKLLCYGGTAINNILPVKDQFYNKDVEFPDYDFFSPNALQDAKDLANIYYKKGFEQVEAKSGSHFGTYKVFVNYIPVADITQIVPELYNNLKKDAIVRNGIYYCPVNFLRMSMYLELSRPVGDLSRWEKVYKRLVLLNKNYPLISKCEKYDVLRKWELSKINPKEISNIIINTASNLDLVFFGGFANAQYMKFLPKNKSLYLGNAPDFDLLSSNPKESITIIKERLEDHNISNIKIVKHKGIGELIAEHYEITISGETCCFVYQPVACHSYNIVYKHGLKLKIASIDTILSFYLAFIYTNRKYFDENRLLCMAKMLFEIRKDNRLKQKGVLKRFSINCYGEQETLEKIRAHKALKYEELKHKQNTKEYEEWFLKYIPSKYIKKNTQKTHKKTSKTKENKSKKTTSKNKPKKTERTFLSLF